MVRVAVIQVQSTRTTAAALEACTRLIDRAAVEHAAGLVVFPELLLEDEDELSAAGKLPSMLLERSSRYQIWLLGSALHRGVTVSLCVSPGGELATRPVSDLERSGSGSFAAESAVYSTPHGKVGLSVGPEALHFKVARDLSLAGADLVCVSLALCSGAELALRVPARAVENELFVAVAAHAREPVEPELYAAHLATLPPEPSGAEAGRAEAERTSVSQIIAPRGHQLACGPIAIAELDLPGAEQEDAPVRSRSITRRPDLYRGFPLRSRSEECRGSIPEIDVAALAFSELGSVSHAIAWAREHLEELAAKEVGLVVLPELFCFDPNLTDLHEAAARDFLSVVQALAKACRRTATHVATTLVEQVDDAYFHVGVLIGQGGIVLRQAQLHVTDQHAWARPGSRLQTARLPWGRLGLVVGADALVPEVLDGLGCSEVDIVAAPLSVRGAGPRTLTLSAAADEAGYAVVGASSPELPGAESAVGASFVADPARWPLQRALPDREALRATIRLQALRDARLSVREAQREAQRSLRAHSQY
ncbi:MAG: hypothetical protein JWN48_4689 [Myxococcaceae bacterium]|nr:hypothetical protein [Myxococcaceae bacterium]